MSQTSFSLDDLNWGRRCDEDSGESSGGDENAQPAETADTKAGCAASDGSATKMPDPPTCVRNVPIDTMNVSDYYSQLPEAWRGGAKKPPLEALERIWRKGASSQLFVGGRSSGAQLHYHVGAII